MTWMAVFGGYNLVLPVKVIEYAGEQGERTGEVNADIEKRLNRAVKSVNKRYGCCDYADGQVCVQLVDDEKSACKVNEQRANLGEHAQSNAEPASASLLLHRNLGYFLVYLDKVIVFLVLAGEYFYEH